MAHTGISRTSIQRDHALITPESHVMLRLPGWHEAAVVVLISGELGAGFRQYRVLAAAGGQLRPLDAAHEYLLLVLQGSVQLELDGAVDALDVDGYAYLPKAAPWRVDVPTGAELLLFEKRYVPLAGVPAPPKRVGRVADVPAEPFLGDPSAQLRCLLPDDAAWDWGINVFEFLPGGTLPNVETHFMQHGLYMLAGEGVYRLGERWYPVQAGDAIWMAPYLPQWFAATGKISSRYIYYKEMNRVPAA